MDISDQGGERQHSFTQAAPNELKLSEGGQSGESWPLAWWLRGVKRRQGRRITVTIRRAFAPLSSSLQNDTSLSGRQLKGHLDVHKVFEYTL